ncbi:MAG: nicotinamide-nucleotide amidase [Sulfurimicrobium sp.]|nr:nicotinamide-nucleotide amidase [Sulfurimicrobium sp.]MDP1896300.1 nicotinamide-nucleotide amidase [Sulfurimicrobium sp.]MDP2198891.1 nicotinamide-nucleotide amidase [Sulfurimicrobium sp.]MDP3689009.1 nicotinamide-nucleotide amidase [Sulfurimicrobium sp.]
MDETLLRLAEETGQALKARGWMLVTAESCTGGWVGEAVTAVAGSSSWYDRGFITYTNASKQEMLGVQPETLQHNGAVSEETVREMAAGALLHSQAHISLAISGIAGPGGGSPDKPVGTVCFAWSIKNGPLKSERRVFAGDREAVRQQAVFHALQGVLALLQL